MGTENVPAPSTDEETQVLSWRPEIGAYIKSAGGSGNEEGVTVGPVYTLRQARVPAEAPQVPTCRLEPPQSSNSPAEAHIGKVYSATLNPVRLDPGLTACMPQREAAPELRRYRAPWPPSGAGLKISPFEYVTLSSVV